MRTGDLTDREWELVGPLLPPERGRPGRPGHDNRRILNGILWRAREGARLARGPGAVREVEHGLAPVRPLARPGRGGVRRPLYLDRVQTTLAVPPPDAAGTVYSSLPPVRVNGRFCSAPFQFGNVLASIRKTRVSSPSTA